MQLDNVLLVGSDPQLVKLCDFGYSKDGTLESACKTTCGTPEYMAPEVSHPPLLFPLHTCRVLESVAFNCPRFGTEYTSMSLSIYSRIHLPAHLPAYPLVPPPARLPAWPRLPA